MSIKFILFCLWFVIAIPFIPQVLVGTDNQPTFTFFAFLFLCHTNTSISKKSLSLILFLFIAFVIAALYSNLLLGINIQIPRFFAFIQFLFALQIGSNKSFYIPEKWFKFSITTYAIFTIIYFMSGGVIENALVASRASGSEELLLSGRGARTLSPEPAIMSIQILNILIIQSLFYKNKKLTFISFILIIISLIGSLSGYGFAIALIIFTIYSPLLVLSIFSIFTLIILLLTININFVDSRIGLILYNLKENGLNFFLMDESFSSRLNSFNEYYSSFIHTFPFGDAFTLMNGGGFISIISALGVLGLIFFFIFFTTIPFIKLNLSYKLLFIFWATIHLLSGSFGVPLVGIIIGKYFKDYLKYE